MLLKNNSANVTLLNLDPFALTRDLYRNEYKLSQRSLNDLLSVEQDVYQANSGNVIAQFDLQDAAINYAVAVDNLLTLLGVDKTTEKDLPNIQ